MAKRVTKKPVATRKSKKSKSNLPFWCLIIGIVAVALGICYVQYQHYLQKKYFKKLGLAQYELGLEAVGINYGNLIEHHADKNKVDAHYLKALCMLECGGTKKINHRFEPHIYNRLLRLKKGELTHYEGIISAQMQAFSDKTIRAMASSWGPFQVMGYHSIQLNISLNDFKGDSCIKYSAQWIADEYGYLIKKQRYKDAFHRHNAGCNYPILSPPKTHDPQYVNKGLLFMEYFGKEEVRP